MARPVREHGRTSSNPSLPPALRLVCGPMARPSGRWSLAWPAPPADDGRGVRRWDNASGLGTGKAGRGPAA